MSALTIGQLRAVIANLDDDTPILPDWDGFEPDDSDPAVEIRSITYIPPIGSPAVGGRGFTGHLSIGVALFHMSDVEATEEEKEDTR